ncbi:MAG: hypothetical protein K5883_06800 [Pseudobutyrivibrio sp.]|nr:hypothetical protein [Pseudobutyrivibrio sp.]
MTYAVRYQSQGGKTKKVAQILAQTLGVEAYDLDTPITEQVDYLFIGGGLYIKRYNQPIKDYLEGTDLSLIGEIVPFATCNEFSNVIKQIRNFCKNNNIKCANEDLCIKWVLEGMFDIGFKGAEFTPELENRIKEFAGKFLA